MARKEVRDENDEVVAEMPVNTDQGPYTGQSMEMPPAPFTPEEIEVLGYDDDGEPITVDRRAEREEFTANAREARQVSVDTTPGH
jgi:hypothetical protein